MNTPAPSKAILLINYDFPPALSGVRRILKFIKYLPENGYVPMVVAAEPAKSAPLDYEALREVEESGILVRRTRSLDPHHFVRRKAHSTESSTNLRSWIPSPRCIGDWLFVPDDRIGWFPFALNAARDLVKKHQVRYILTSSFPNTAHLVGLRLKKKYNVKWVADFRDGWTQNPYFGSATALHAAANRRLESAVVHAADAVITVSQPIADHLAGIDSKDKVHVIPNGFDPSDHEGIEPLSFEKFTIAYTGTMFMQRSPLALFQAVRQLLDEHPGLANSFQIIFRSNMKPEYERAINQLGIGHVIQNWGLGTHREALQLQLSADALLVMEGTAKNAEIMLTQKVFEYLAARKPILCIAPHGALADLVRKTRTGVVLPPENVFRIKETLLEAFHGLVRFNPDEVFISGFSRQRQATELARILNAL